MKVSLVRIPSIVDDTAFTAPICPPIGLAYLVSVVKKYSNDIQVIDTIGNSPKIKTINSKNHSFKLLGQSKDKIVDLISKNSDMILISCMFSQDWLYAKLIIHEFRPFGFATQLNYTR